MRFLRPFWILTALARMTVVLGLKWGLSGFAKGGPVGEVFCQD